MFKRYALYFAPADRGLMRAAAQWLGWDVEKGAPVAQPPIDGLEAATKDPRKYGFHATIKAPFRLAEGKTADDLQAEVALQAGVIAPVVMPSIGVATLGGRFLALRPRGDEMPLQQLCGQIVTRFSPFRAPLSDAEFARRRPETLTPRQRELLVAYGYPYVFEEFRFHMTLTGDLQGGGLDRFRELAKAWFSPHLPQPFVVDQLCLFGEDAAGHFHLIDRHQLRG